MEGAHGELGAGLADGLGGDHARRLAHLHQAAGGQVAAVAADADAAPGLAGEHGTDAHALDARRLDGARQVFIHLLVDIHDEVAFVVMYLFERNAPHDAVAKRLDDFARFDDGLDVDAVHRPAVKFRDDDVLRHVHQPPGEVARVCGLQSRVGQSLARAVRRDEELQHVQAFAEVRGDGRLDDFARRLRHQAPHAGKLANLLLGAARAGVRHDVNGIEQAFLVLALHGLEHFVRDLVGDA